MSVFLSRAFHDWRRVGLPRSFGKTLKETSVSCCNVFASCCFFFFFFFPPFLFSLCLWNRYVSDLCGSGGLCVNAVFCNYVFCKALRKQKKIFCYSYPPPNNYCLPIVPRMRLVPPHPPNPRIFLPHYRSPSHQLPISRRRIPQPNLEIVQCDPEWKRSKSNPFIFYSQDILEHCAFIWCCAGTILAD